MKSVFIVLGLCLTLMAVSADESTYIKMQANEPAEASPATEFVAEANIWEADPHLGDNWDDRATHKALKPSVSTEKKKAKSIIKGVIKATIKSQKQKGLRAGKTTTTKKGKRDPCVSERAGPETPCSRERPPDVVRKEKRKAARKAQAKPKKKGQPKKVQPKKKLQPAKPKKKEPKAPVWNNYCEVPTTNHHLKGMCRAYKRFCKLYKDFGLHGEAKRHCTKMANVHARLVHEQATKQQKEAAAKASAMAKKKHAELKQKKHTKQAAKKKLKKELGGMVHSVEKAAYKTEEKDGLKAYPPKIQQ